MRKFWIFIKIFGVGFEIASSTAALLSSNENLADGTAFELGER